MSDRTLTRRERERRGIHVTGVLMLLWVAYTVALPAPVGPWSPLLVAAWVVAGVHALAIIVTMALFDRWIKAGDDD